MNYIYKVFPITAENLVKLNLAKSILINANNESRSALVVKRPEQLTPSEDLTETRPIDVPPSPTNLDFGGTLFETNMKISLWLVTPPETTAFDLIGFEEVETYDNVDFFIQYTYIYTAMNVVEDCYTFKVIDVNSENLELIKNTVKTILPNVDIEQRTDIILAISDGNVTFGASDAYNNKYGMNLKWSIWLKDSELPTFSLVEGMFSGTVQTFTDLTLLNNIYLNI